MPARCINAVLGLLALASVRCAYGDFIAPAPVFPINAPFYADFPHVVTQGTATSSSASSHRKHPLTLDFDLAGERGTPIITMLPGTANVFLESEIPGGTHGLGNYVTVDHGPDPLAPETSRVFSLYAHLDSITVADKQSVGQSAPQVIGLEGDTGVGDVHLHVGMYRGDPRAVPPGYERPDDYEGRDPTNPFILGLWTPIGFTADQPIAFVDADGNPVLVTTDSVPEGAPLVTSINTLFHSELYSSVQQGTDVEEEYLMETGGLVRYAFYLRTVADLLLHVLWGGSEVSIRTITPDGNTFSLLQDTDGDISETITGAKPGLWVFELEGLDLAPQGELVSLRIESATSTVSTPEPSTVASLALGLALLGLVRWHSSQERGKAPTS